LRDDVSYRFVIKILFLLTSSHGFSPVLLLIFSSGLFCDQFLFRKCVLLLFLIALLGVYGGFLVLSLFH